MARRRLVRRAIAALTICGALLWLSTSAAAVAEARANWGEDVAVLVVTTDVSVGDVLDAGDVRRVSMPRSIVAQDALTTLAEVRGATRTALFAGEMIRARDLAEPGRVSAPADHHAMVLRRTDQFPPAEAGDRLTLFLYDDGFTELASAPVSVVVLETSDETVIVAVAAADAAAMADALARGRIVAARS